MATDLKLGAALRAIRTSRRLSLAEVAEATRISPSFLSLVELGKSDITIGRLTRLAEFKMSFTDLLGGEEVSDAEVVRTHERRLIHSPAEGIDVYLLAADTRRTMMPMLLVFEPSAELAEYGRHEGEEFVHVIDGSMVLELEGAEPRLLETGDSASTRPSVRTSSGTRAARRSCGRCASTRRRRRSDPSGREDRVELDLDEHTGWDETLDVEGRVRGHDVCEELCVCSDGLPPVGFAGQVEARTRHVAHRGAEGDDSLDRALEYEPCLLVRVAGEERLAVVAEWRSRADRDVVVDPHRARVAGDVFESARAVNLPHRAELT